MTCTHTWTLESRERNDHRCALCGALGWRGLGNSAYRDGNIRVRRCRAKCGRVATMAVIRSERTFYCSEGCVPKRTVRVAS
jgi:hypothetical protein